MQLDRLDAVLRPRNTWEAIDLGIQMARRHFLRLWVLWWLSALPVAMVVILLLQEYPSFIGTAVWWFKPAFEPLLVFWLSRALFGDHLSIRETARQWWQVSRRRLLPNLLWRRLSPNRSFFMPITVLEKPDRTSWSKRAKLFKRDHSGGFWLTVVGIHFETILMIGLVIGIVMLIPHELLPAWDLTDWFADNNAIVNWVTALSALLVMSLIAPFYVAGGFALYLSRRTDLEAWDIELNFRRFVQKLQPALPVLLLSLIAFVGVTPEADAADDRMRSAEVIEAVLKDPVFGKTEERKVWALDFDLDADDEKPSDINLEPLADLLSVLLWLAVAGVVAWLIVQAIRYNQRHAQPGLHLRPPDTAHANEVTALGTNGQEALPRDVPGTVRDYLRQNRVRAAVALLYRASLAVLASRYGLELGESATEGECLRRVRKDRPDDESKDFAELTREWVRVAYADLPPGEARVMALLDAWIRHYADAGAQS